MFQRYLGPLSLHRSIDSNISTHANVHVHALLGMHMCCEQNNKNITIASMMKYHNITLQRPTALATKLLLNLSLLITYTTYK